MTIVEIKKALIEKMKTKYPESEYRYYGVEVVEGYKRPSFFTQLRPVVMEFANKNSTENILAFTITYFQKQVDEADMLRKADGIRELFGKYLMVGDRALDISDFGFEYAGNDRNILEVSFDLGFFGRLEADNEAELISAVEVETDMVSADGQAVG